MIWSKYAGDTKCCELRNLMNESGRQLDGESTGPQRIQTQMSRMDWLVTCLRRSSWLEHRQCRGWGNWLAVRSFMHGK